MSADGTPTLGIDIGGTSVKAALLVAGRMTASGTSATYARPTREQLLAAIRQACRSLVGDVRAVGLCAPGAWDEATKSIVHSANVPGVVGTPLDTLVRESTGLHAPLHIFTDAYAAAYDVWASERLQGRLLAVSIGTGVGAAVLDDGKLLQVTGRSSGHMGQWDVTLESDPAGVPLAPDGSRGTVEAYLGAAALCRRYGCDAVRIIDHLAVDEAPIRALVRVLRIAHAIYRPNHVRVLGGLGVRLVPMLPSIYTKVCDKLTSLARPDWTLGAGRDTFHAARGAARLAS